MFEPGLIAALYDAGRAACSLADVRAAKESGAVTALREVLGTPDGLGPDGLDTAVEHLRRGAAAADSTGPPVARRADRAELARRPAGPAVARLHDPARAPGRLAPGGLRGARADGLEANVLTELRVGWDPQSYTASRGWSPEAMDAATAVLTARGLVGDDGLTAEGTALRDGIEDATDRMVQPVVDAIGDDLPGLLKLVDGWSQQIVDRGWFPPDPYKRASG